MACNLTCLARYCRSFSGVAAPGRSPGGSPFEPDPAEPAGRPNGARPEQRAVRFGERHVVRRLGRDHNAPARNREPRRALKRPEGHQRTSRVGEIVPLGQRLTAQVGAYAHRKRIPLAHRLAPATLDCARGTRNSQNRCADCTDHWFGCLKPWTGLWMTSLGLPEYRAF